MNRLIILSGEKQLRAAIITLNNLPLDGSKQIEIKDYAKVRSIPQNSRLWGAVLRDVAEQAWVGGRQFSADTWHYFLKCEYLPEGDEENLAELVKNPAEWAKWEWMPDGDRRCVGSTTKLTKKGMMIYQTAVEAYAVTELGVMFSADARMGV